MHWNSSETLPCRVTELEVSTDNKITYNAVTLEKYVGIQHNYSRESILFIQRKYSNDEYLKGVFRHYITIKDEMVPSQWKEKNKDPCDLLNNKITREMCKNVRT